MVIRSWFLPKKYGLTRKRLLLSSYKWSKQNSASGDLLIYNQISRHFITLRRCLMCGPQYVATGTRLATGRDFFRQFERITNESERCIISTDKDVSRFESDSRMPNPWSGAAIRTTQLSITRTCSSSNNDDTADKEKKTWRNNPVAPVFNENLFGRNLAVDNLKVRCKLQLMDERVSAEKRGGSYLNVKEPAA